jgi:hypothetical protein
MIDRSIPVVLQLKHEGRDALCVANLMLEPGRLFATPIWPAQWAQPYRPKLIPIEESNLKLVPGEKRGLPIYEYRGYVIVP